MLFKKVPGGFDRLDDFFPHVDVAKEPEKTRLTRLRAQREPVGPLITQRTGERPGKRFRIAFACDFGVVFDAKIRKNGSQEPFYMEFAEQGGGAAADEDRIGVRRTGFVATQRYFLAAPRNFLAAPFNFRDDGIDVARHVRLVSCAGGEIAICALAPAKRHVNVQADRLRNTARDANGFAGETIVNTHK